MAKDVAQTAGEVRLKGTMAARALMGRKRVYGAVVIQHWFRRMQQQQKQRERENVKNMLRERREKKEEEEEARRKQQDLVAASLRSEKEHSLKAALERREQEVERATQRLKRNLQASLSGGVQAFDSPPEAFDGELLSKSQDSPPQPTPPKETNTVDGISSRPPLLVQGRTAGCERGPHQEQRDSLMDALRVSVERSADLMGLVRPSASPSASVKSAPLAMSAATVMTARCDWKDEGAWRNEASHLEDSPAALPHAECQMGASGNEHAVGFLVSQGMPPASESCPAELPQAPSPCRLLSASLSLSSVSPMSDLLHRRSEQANMQPEMAMLLMPPVSPIGQKVEEGHADMKVEKGRADMDTAAKELQHSILSFLDCAEADTRAPSCSPWSSSSVASVPPAARRTSPRTSPGVDRAQGDNEERGRGRHGARRALGLPVGDPIGMEAGRSGPGSCCTRQSHSPALRSCDEMLAGVGVTEMLMDSCGGGTEGCGTASSSLTGDSRMLSHGLGGGNGAPLMAAQVYSEVKARMSSLKIELQHKDKVISDLKDALSRQKQEVAAQVSLRAGLQCSTKGVASPCRCRARCLAAAQLAALY